jgi:hypothetical protein
MSRLPLGKGMRVAVVRNGNNDTTTFEELQALIAGKADLTALKYINGVPIDKIINGNGTLNPTVVAQIYQSFLSESRKNRVPDSDIKFGSTYYTLSGLSITNGASPIGGNAFTFTGTGAASGNQSALSDIIDVTPGETVCLSGYIDATHCTVNAPFWAIYDTTGTTQYAVASGVLGKAQRVAAKWLVPAGVTQVIVVPDTNNATVANATKVVFSEPQFESGDQASSYMPNLANDSTGYLKAGAAAVDISSAIHPASTQTSYLSSVTGGQRNMVPDSDIKFGQIYWTYSSPFSLIKGGWDGSGNSLYAAGTGAPFTSQTARTAAFPVTAGQTVTVSFSFYNSVYVTSGACGVIANDQNNNQYTILTIPNTDGRHSASWTVPAGVTSIKLGFDLATATVTSGHGIYFRQLQCEIGAAMTAYRTTDDTGAYSLVAGSGPVSTPSARFSYTSNTNTILWSWAGFAWYQADGTSFGIANSSTGPGSLASATTYKFYPYFDLLVGTNVAFVTGGSGSPTYAWPSGGSTYAASQQALAYRVPLSAGGMSASTTSSGSGSGSGGGYNCLHPNSMLDTERGSIRAHELIDGDRLRTPNGWQAVESIERAEHSEWLHVKFSNGQEIICTLSHVLMAPNGEPVKARDLRIMSILDGDGHNVAVTGLELLKEDAERVSFSIPGHLYYACRGGALEHNTVYKP